jgi:putative Holliday junction resolvase
LKVAAVDYGRRRIGLAVCDPLGITVRGLDTIDRGGGSLEAAADAVAAVLREERAERVVVGLPLHDDGRESEMSREARAFGEALARRLSAPVEWFDEGLTSWEAEETLKAGKRRLKDARQAGEVDKAAAVALLRSWMRAQEVPPSPPPADAAE